MPPCAWWYFIVAWRNLSRNYLIHLFFTHRPAFLASFILSFSHGFHPFAAAYRISQFLQIQAMDLDLFKVHRIILNAPKYSNFIPFPKLPYNPPETFCGLKSHAFNACAVF